ncbi:MAG: VTT domain-containing protein [Oxalobacter sp.]|nr:VTT domain-containing protein [Oxalobacter sp.]
MDFVQFFDLILHVDKVLGNIIAQYGTWVYFILFAIIFCETGLVVAPFLPGDSLLFISGAFCATGAIDLKILAGSLLVAAVLGDNVNYVIGRKIGDAVFTKDYKWIDKKALNYTHEFFEKHGGKTITLCRFIPLVRTFAPFVAGVTKMKMFYFQMYNLLGAVLWIIGLTVGGYFFGNIPIIRDHLNTIVLLGVGAAIVPLILGGLYKLFKKSFGSSQGGRSNQGEL